MRDLDVEFQWVPAEGDEEIALGTVFQTLKRVELDHLLQVGDTADDGRALEAELLGPGRLDGRLHPWNVGRARSEQHVAARDDGAYVLEAELLEHAAQILVALVGVGGADPPQKSDVLRHEASGPRASFRAKYATQRGMPWRPLLREPRTKPGLVHRSLPRSHP